MIKACLFFSILLIFINIESKAQYSFITQYSDNSTTPDDRAYSCAQSSDGNFLIAALGYNPSSLQRDLFILKLNNVGDTIWTKFYNFSNVPELPRKIISTPDSGFAVTGDDFILKANAIGVVEWLKTGFGRAGKWIEKISEGYILCVQDTPVIFDASSNNYIIKLDDNGNLLSEYQFLSGIENWLYRITGIENGDYLISADSYTHTYSFAYMIITDSNLIVKSIFSFEGSHSTCIQTKDKNFVMAFGGLYDRIVKIDSIGNTLWATDIVAGRYYPSDIDTTLDGGILVCGNSYNLQLRPAYITISNFDSLGGLISTISECCYNNNPALKSTADGGYITIGNDTSIAGKINVLKFGPPGTMSCLHTVSDSSWTGILPANVGVASFQPVFIPMNNDTAIIFSGGIVNQQCFSTAISESLPKKNLFQIIPNPSMQEFNLKFGEKFTGKGILIITNQLGNVVYKEEIADIKSGDSKNIYLGNSPGIYYIRVIDKMDVYLEKLILIN